MADSWLNNYPEYPPASGYCDGCGREIDYDEDIFEIDRDKFYCEECFEQYCHDNLDIYELAKLWHCHVRKGEYLV